jgi:hypothetical protein
MARKSADYGRTNVKLTLMFPSPMHSSSGGMTSIGDSTVDGNDWDEDATLTTA